MQVLLGWINGWDFNTTGLISSCMYYYLDEINILLNHIDVVSAPFGHVV